MVVLVIGLLIFLGIHSARMVAGGYRDAQVAANPGRWKGLYSVVSAIGLALIVWGWAVYRPEAPELYTPPGWGRHVAMLLVLLAFVLLPAAYLPAGRLRHWVKHPMVLAVILWSIAHLLANGDLASVLTFGAILVWAAADRIAVISRGDPAPVVVRPMSDAIATALGVVLFLVFGFWLHGPLFGVSPFG